MNSNTHKKLNDPLEILKNSSLPLNKDKEKVIKSLEELKIEEEEFLEKEKLDQRNFIKEWKLINLNYTDNYSNKTQAVQTYNYTENLDRKLNMIKKYSFDDIKSILDQQKLSSDVFLDLLNFIGELSNYFILNREIHKLIEIMKYFKIILESKFYSQLKIFVGKKQKAYFSNLKKEYEKEEYKEKINTSETNHQDMNSEYIQNILNMF